MKAGIVNDRTWTGDFLETGSFEKAKRAIENPSVFSRIVKAVNPTAYKETLSRVMTRTLNDATDKRMALDGDYFLNCLEQGATFKDLSAGSMTNLMTLDDPKIRPYIKQVLKDAMESDADHFYDYPSGGAAPTDEWTKEKLAEGRGRTIATLFHKQYDHETPDAVMTPMNPSVAQYLKEAIAESDIEHKAIFKSYDYWMDGKECCAVIANDFLKSGGDVNCLAHARVTNPSEEMGFLKACIDGGMDERLLLGVIDGIRANVYTYGTELADSIFKAGISADALIDNQAGWYGLNDDDGHITKHLLENKASIEKVTHVPHVKYTFNQNQFDALWDADPIETNLNAVHAALGTGKTKHIDHVLSLIESKGVEPNFEYAHSEGTFTPTYSEKHVNALDRQGLLDQFKHSLLVDALERENLDGIDHMIKKGAVLDDRAIKGMTANYNPDDETSYLTTMTHIITVHGYKPTPAIKEHCKKDTELSNLFANLETHDRLQAKMPPRENQQHQRPVAKKQKSQTMKI